VTRSSWDETWLNVADVVARRSLCVRDQVGAVIVNVSNRIVATGYNGPPRGFTHSNLPCRAWCQRAALTNRDEKLNSDYTDCPSSHAELNGLSVCDRSAREGGTIYVTSDVCFGCAKVIANSGLRRVVVRRRERGTHRNPERSYELLTNCELEVTCVS
jgi:dCMP deaminase